MRKSRAVLLATGGVVGSLFVASAFAAPAGAPGPFQAVINAINASTASIVASINAAAAAVVTAVNSSGGKSTSSCGLPPKPADIVNLNGYVGNPLPAGRGLFPPLISAANGGLLSQPVGTDPFLLPPGYTKTVFGVPSNKWFVVTDFETGSSGVSITSHPRTAELVEELNGALNLKRSGLFTGVVGITLPTGVSLLYAHFSTPTGYAFSPGSNVLLRASAVSGDPNDELVAFAYTITGYLSGCM